MFNINTDKMEVSDAKRIDSWLGKFQITALNPMQEEAYKTIGLKADVVLLSPTGTGKTLALSILL